MICFRCGAENPVSFRFCQSCGRPLGQSCLACGFENPPESKFCGGCGARLQEVRLEDAEGERRQLTVLFCDIVGSTQLSQVLDPEDLGELIAAYQKVCGDAVRAHEGHIAHYLGDGVVVYFGYPRAHEDEAQRAVRCGLEILAGVEELRERGEAAGETALGVRLGAHTGRVVVGPVGAGDRKDRLALGDTPNIAARIQTEAETGTLTVSEATWKIVEGYFTGKCLGRFHLRGVSEPMRLWLITGESPSRERVEVASDLTPFIGRYRERRILEEAWKASQTGCSQFVLLWGEPGMGKSRLAQLFRDEVQFSAHELLSLRATPYDTTSPFHPVIELIERRCQIDRPMAPLEGLDALEEGLRELGLADPEAISLLGSLLSLPVEERYPPPALSPARRRGRTLELLVEFVTAIARAGLTFLLVEDLHWTDASTLEFLELLVTRRPSVPLLGVLTTRPELEAEWTAAPAVQMVELARFEANEAEAAVRGVMLGKALPDDVLRHIIDRSEGVPLFVEELTRSVLDSGMLNERAASWEAVRPVSAEEIPATMDASLTARIDRLGASRATAQLAATIGREFSFDLLREVSERDDATLRQDLERLLRAGLAWPVAEENDTYVFKHALLRDAAYNTLLRSTRQRYHRRIADALRQRFAEHGSTRPDLVADHLSRAGDHEDAVASWEAAGRQAVARTALYEASEHLQRAIDCLGSLPETPERQERELELLILLAPLLMTVYGWGAVKVERACERALELAQGLQFDRSYPLLWGFWTVHFLRGEMAPALEAAGPVLEMAQASAIPMFELTGRHATSYTRVYRGEFEQALEEAEAGLALYDFDQEQELIEKFQLSSSVCLRASKGHALWMLGRVPEAEDEWEGMLQLGRNLEHPPTLAAALAFALHGGGFRYSYVDQMERLVDTADELLALCQQADFFLWYAVAYTYRGIVAAAAGEARARTQMHEGLELFTQTGSRLTLVMMNILCAEAFYRLGDDDEAFQRLQVAEAEMKTREERLLAPEIWRLRGRLLARQGDRPAAETAYRQALERAGAQQALSLELRTVLDLYELRAGEGRPEEGRALLASILERFTQGLDRPEPARALAIVRASS